jgi:uncharacterized membrane protein YkvA (DUF1232 family)
MLVKLWKQRVKELETEVYAHYAAFRHDHTPLAAKGVIVLTVAYFVNPIDPIPDFIPGLGLLDELLVIPIGVVIARNLIPDDVLAECRATADEEIDVGNARWVVAGLTMLVWVVVLAWLLGYLGVGG